MKGLLRGMTALAGLAIFAALSGPAHAADAEELPPPDYSWSGLYVGAYVGAGALVVPTYFNAADAIEFDIDGDGGEGFLAGAMLGYNLQMSERFLVGIQGDVAYTEMDAVTFVGGAELGLDFMASASLRAGYLVTPDTLLYILGGYSYGEFEVDFPELDVDNYDGFHAGFGMETRLTERLTARVEYRYTEFDRETALDTDDPVFEAIFAPRIHTGTVGLAYNLFPTAGDGQVASPAADVTEPVASWTGLYAGASGGAGAFIDDSARPEDGISYGGEGFFGSLMAGFNWQVGDRFVLGLQGDIGLADMDWQGEIDFLNGTLVQQNEVDLDWFASASLRAGWLPSPETMIYAIGGFSYAHFVFETNSDAPGLFSVSDSEDYDFDGYHVGLGIEGMLGDHVTARVEYRYTDYGEKDLVNELSSAEINPSSHTGTIGIAWLFNPL